jgi:hypothetical protein
LAKSRPIVVICIADGSHFARERLMAFTLWHPDAVSGSHPPHLGWVIRDPAEPSASRAMSAVPPKAELDSEHSRHRPGHCGLMALPER